MFVHFAALADETGALRATQRLVVGVRHCIVIRVDYKMNRGRGSSTADSLHTLTQHRAGTGAQPSAPFSCPPCNRVTCGQIFSAYLERALVRTCIICHVSSIVGRTVASSERRIAERDPGNATGSRCRRQHLRLRQRSAPHRQSMKLYSNSREIVHELCTGNATNLQR